MLLVLKVPVFCSIYTVMLDAGCVSSSLFVITTGFRKVTERELFRHLRLLNEDEDQYFRGYGVILFRGLED